MQSMSFAAQLKYIVLSILFVIASINFTRTALDILNNSKRLDTLKTEVSALETRENELNDSISYKQSAEFIEERARNALNLIKPNEKVFVPSSLASDAEMPTELAVASKAPAKEETALAMWIKLLVK